MESSFRGLIGRTETTNPEVVGFESHPGQRILVKLHNTGPLICISLNHNCTCCVIPRSSKRADKVDLSGPVFKSCFPLCSLHFFMRLACLAGARLNRARLIQTCARELIQVILTSRAQADVQEKMSRLTFSRFSRRGHHNATAFPALCAQGCRSFASLPVNLLNIKQLCKLHKLRSPFTEAYVVSRRITNYILYSRW